MAIIIIVVKHRGIMRKEYRVFWNYVTVWDLNINVNYFSLAAPKDF